MPRGRKPKVVKEKTVVKEKLVEAPVPEKKKRGRPKKVEAPPVVETPKPAEEPKPVVSKKTKPVEKKPEPPPLTPEEQKALDKHHAEFKKKIDAATKNATADNVIEKIFDALGKSTVDW